MAFAHESPNQQRVSDVNDSALVLFILAGGLSYLYAFVGAFTDAANAIATSVGTQVLTPRQAVT
jgi:hypothetical protein